MKDTDWEILYELYKVPNMTKVANLLYMTQPSLTKRLKNMETEFQVQIVKRTPKGIEFTPEGEYLASCAEEYLRFMKRIQAKMNEFREKESGKILIGSAYTYSKYKLTDILLRYSEKYPHISFEVINDQSNILFRRMLAGTIDVGFICGDYEGAVNQILVSQCSAYLVTRESVPWEKLPGMKRIGYKTNDRSAELLDSWWKEQFGTEAPAALSVGYMDFAWPLIQKGAGYTYCFLPDNFDNEYDLCLTPLKRKDGSRVIRNTWFIYPKDKRISGTLEDFIRYIDKEIAIH